MNLLINIHYRRFVKWMNELILFDLEQLQVKQFQKSFYKDADELYDVDFLIEVEEFDEVEYVNE